MAAPAKHPTKKLSPLEVKPTTVEDVLWLAPRLRQADKDEIMASCGESALPGMLRAYFQGHITLTIHAPDQPIGIFGISGHIQLSDGDTAGVIWALCTNLAFKYKKDATRVAMEWLPVLAAGTDKLTNHIDSRNTKHISWIEAMGFTVKTDDPTFLHDPEVPFYRFVM